MLSGGALLALIVLVAAGCGTTSGTDGTTQDSSSKAESPSGKKIAMFLPNTASIRFTKIDGPVFEKSVKKLCPDCEVSVQNAGGQATTQQSQVEAAITQGADVLVIDPFDGAAMASAVRDAKAQGIPVINYDSMITDAPLNYYISFDAKQVGELLARSVVDEMKKRGTFGQCMVVIRGDPTDQNQIAYWKGSLPLLKQANAKICFNSTTPGWASEPAQDEMDQAITKIGADKIGGVYVMNDSMADGVVAALVKAGVDPFPPVTGQDGDTAAIQRILAGQQFMTVWKNTVKLAQKAAEIAVDFASGKPPAGETKVDNGAGEVPTTLLPSTAVTVDNIKDTVIANGFVELKDVCTDEYAKYCAKHGLG